MKVPVSDESSKFKFGNFIIHNNEWDKKCYWGLLLKHWFDWNLKKSTDVLFGNWNSNLKFQSYK